LNFSFPLGYAYPGDYNRDYAGVVKISDGEILFGGGASGISDSQVYKYRLDGGFGEPFGLISSKAENGDSGSKYKIVMVAVPKGLLECAP
jgi:hypothetical protein